MPYLKNLNTGEVYPMNEHLLRRGDFVEIETLDAAAPAVEEVVLDAPKPKRARAKKAETVETPVDEPEFAAADVDLGDIDIDVE